MNIKKHQHLIISHSLRACVTPNMRAVWFDLNEEFINITLLFSEIDPIDHEAIREFKENYMVETIMEDDKYQITSMQSKDPVTDIANGHNIVFLRKEHFHDPNHYDEE